METLQPKLRFPYFKENWQKNKLIDINIRVIDGDRGSNYPNGKDFSVSGYCLFLNAKNVTKNGFSFIETSFISKEKDEQLSKGKLDRNDIVLTTRGSVGHISYFDNSIQFENLRINSGMVIIRSDESYIIPDYLYKYFNSNQIQNEIKTVAFGSAQPQLTVNEILKFKICYPTKPEQTKIADFLSSVDEKLNLLKEKKSLLEDYKKGIMQKIFNQEIRFKDDNGTDFEEWEEKKLGDIIVFLADYTANGSFKSLKDNVQYYNVENYAALIRTTDLEKKNFKPERFTDKKGYEFLKKTSLFGNELVLANVGSIGKVYKVPKYTMPMTLAPNTYTLKFSKDCNLDFYFQWMLTIEFKNKLLSMVGSSTLKAINKSNLRDIDTFYPCIDEQTKIANFLSAIDEKIELVSNQIQDTQEYKKGLLQQMFV